MDRISGCSDGVPSRLVLGAAPPAAPAAQAPLPGRPALQHGA